MAEQRVLSSIGNKAGQGLTNLREATQHGVSVLQRLALQNTQRQRPQPQLQHPLMTSNQNQVGSMLQAGHMFACMAIPLLYIPSVC
jgi:hypothetical protein